jgi:hypothetical protein
MFASADLKSAVIGTGILLSSIGLTTASANAQERTRPHDQNATPTQVEKNADLLDTASRVDRLSGPLAGVRPPAYDGPIAWASYLTPGSTMALGAVVGVAFGAVGGVLGMITSYDDRISRRNAMAGAAIGLAIPLGFAGSLEQIKVIDFPTVVRSIESDTPPHYETRQSGQSTVTTGPYFGQVVSIAETDIPLASNNFNAPLIPGQKINARFYINSDNQIVGWNAQPGAR